MTFQDLKNLFFSETDGAHDDEIPTAYAEEILLANTDVLVATSVGNFYGVVYLTWPEYGKVEVDYYDADYPHNNGWLRETFDVSQVALWSVFGAEKQTAAFAAAH